MEISLNLEMSRTGTGGERTSFSFSYIPARIYETSARRRFYPLHPSSLGGGPDLATRGRAGSRFVLVRM